MKKIFVLTVILITVLLVPVSCGPSGKDTIEGKRMKGSDYELLISGGPGSYYWTWRNEVSKCVYDSAEIGDGLKVLVDECKKKEQLFSLQD